ncbi:MAG TPA: class I SAM-dependent methyltransferase [Gemmatimonadaceae bacterium]|nr:class I SAM-dependent methyltransferase [Gemmatimonadaceae bacterium]
MAERSASLTARGVAVLRAAHSIVDGKPPILDDHVIGRLLGPDFERQVHERIDELQNPTARGLRSHVLLRSRYAEDCLADAVGRGVSRYVLLGAGLDTFAYRQPAWARDIEIIEVDQPASQAMKRAMLDAAGVVVPGNVRYADVDFERESLAAAFARHGIDTGTPTFFSWLGVTMYLERQAIDAVLATVASFPRGSEIVLTFAQPRGADDPGARFAEQAAAVGEPWVSYFTPEEMRTLLEGHGFSSVALLERDEAERRYFAGRSDGLLVPRRTAIVRATV